MIVAQKNQRAQKLSST